MTGNHKRLDATGLVASQMADSGMKLIVHILVMMTLPQVNLYMYLYTEQNWRSGSLIIRKGKKGSGN